MQAQQYKYDINASEVVAQSGFYKLTVGDLNASIEYMEFILAQKLDARYRQAAQSSLTQQFQANPTMIVNEVQQVRQVLPSIIQLTDIAQIANFRNQVITTLYANFSNYPNKPLLLQLFDQLNPILVYDAVDNICLTNRDINALIEFSQFGLEIMGQTPQQISPEERQNFIKTMEGQVYTMSQEEQQNVLILADYLPLMKKAYAQLSPDQKAQIQQQYAQSMAAAEKQAKLDSKCPGCSNKLKELYAKQERGELTQVDLMEMERELQARRENWKIMNNMNMQNHVGMLNIIENMGGGDGYYKIEYKNW